MNYHKFRRVFKQITYNVAIPRYRTLHNRPFQILLSQHGTREDNSALDGDNYVQYPLDYDDPFFYDLIVISPSFPPGTSSTPTGTPEGKNFQRFDGEGLTWLNDLFHTELPRLFSENSADVQFGGQNINVDLNKFYFFGHSRGGMTVHTYIMKFGGGDIIKALSGSGQLIPRSDSSYAVPGMIQNEQDYLNRLDSFIRTPVFSVLGTHEDFDTGRTRIRNIREYICREIDQRVSINALSFILPNTDPPVPIINDIPIACNTFPPPVIPVKSPPIPDDLVKYRFLWNPNSNHRGWKNYRHGRKFLLKDRQKKSIMQLFVIEPVRAIKRILGINLMDEKLRLKAELEEKLDVPIPK